MGQTNRPYQDPASTNSLETSKHKLQNLKMFLHQKPGDNIIDRILGEVSSMNLKFANGAATAAMVHLLNHEEGLQELLANDDQGDVFYYDVKARDLSVDLEKQFDKTIAVGEGIGILGKIKSGRGLLSGLFKRNATEVVTNPSDLAGVPLTPVDAGISLASETTKMFGGVGKGMVHTTRRTRGGSWQTSYRAVHMRGSTIIRDTGWVTIDSIQPLRSMAISQGNRAANTTMNKWESALND